MYRVRYTATCSRHQLITSSSHMMVATVSWRRCCRSCSDRNYLKRAARIAMQHILNRLLHDSQCRSRCKHPAAYLQRAGESPTHRLPNRQVRRACTAKPPMLPISNADDAREFRHLRGKVDWQIVIIEDSRCVNVLLRSAAYACWLFCHFRCNGLLAVRARAICPDPHQQPRWYS
jgi:hypothetical protein